MLGILNLQRRDWGPMTLKEVTIRYDAVMLHQWDQTASILCLLHGLQCTIINVNSKSRIKPRSFYDFHPYREKKQQGLLVNPSNISVLRKIGNALAKK